MTQLAGSMANGEVVNAELLGSIELKSLSEVVIEDKLRKLAPEQAVARNEPVQRQNALAAGGKARSVEARDSKSLLI
jgi:hypothetical protein